MGDDYEDDVDWEEAQDDLESLPTTVPIHEREIIVSKINCRIREISTPIVS